MLPRTSVHLSADRNTAARSVYSNETRRGSSQHQQQSPSYFDEDGDSEPSFSSALIQTSTPHKSHSKGSNNDGLGRSRSLDADESDDKDLRASDTESLDEGEFRTTKNILKLTHANAPLPRNSLLQSYQGLVRYNPTPSSGSSTLVDQESVLQRQQVNERFNHEKTQNAAEDDIFSSMNRQQRRIERGNAMWDSVSESSSSPNSRLNTRFKRTPETLSAYVEAKTIQAKASKSTSARLQIREDIDSTSTTPKAPGAFPTSIRKPTPNLLRKKTSILSSPTINASSTSTSLFEPSSVNPGMTQAKSSQAIHQAFSEHITGPRGALTQSAERRALLSQNDGRLRKTPSSNSKFTTEALMLEQVKPDNAANPVRETVATSSTTPRARRANLRTKAHSTNNDSTVPSQMKEVRETPLPNVELTVTALRQNDTRKVQVVPVQVVEVGKNSPQNSEAYEGDHEESRNAEMEEDGGDNSSVETSGIAVLEGSAVRFAMEDSMVTGANSMSAEKPNLTNTSKARSRSRSRSSTPPLPPPLPHDLFLQYPALQPTNANARRLSLSLDQGLGPISPSRGDANRNRNSNAPPVPSNHAKIKSLRSPEFEDLGSSRDKGSRGAYLENDTLEKIGRTEKDEPFLSNISNYDGSTLHEIASELLKVVQSLHLDSKNHALSAERESVSMVKNSPLAEERMTEATEIKIESKRKELEQELHILQEQSTREKARRDELINQLMKEQGEEERLMAQFASLKLSMEQMGIAVSEQVSSVVQETFKSESQRRSRWIILLLLLQIVLIVAMFRYANVRANHLFQTVYYDPFYPAVFLPPPSDTLDNVLEETLTLFQPSRAPSHVTLPMLAFLQNWASKFRLGTSHTRQRAAQHIGNLWGSWRSSPASKYEQVQI